jgi:hypothetical protein
MKKGMCNFKMTLEFHMDAYDRCTSLGKKNLADIVAIYGRGRELSRPPTYPGSLADAADF